MRNAREEFIETIEGLNTIVSCAIITTEENDNTSILKRRYNKEQFDQFLSDLDFDYDNGYGGQELFGYIWLWDGKWFEREVYDGSEKWRLAKQPNFERVMEYYEL